MNMGFYLTKTKNKRKEGWAMVVVTTPSQFGNGYCPLCYSLTWIHRQVNDTLNSISTLHSLIEGTYCKA